MATRGARISEATRPRRTSSRGGSVATSFGAAPVLIVPWVTFAGSHPYGDAERAHAEREMFLLSGGAAIQNLLLALHAQGVASCWISSTLFCQEETRAVLGMADEWFALGTVAAGPMPEGGASRPRPPIDLAEFPAAGASPHDAVDEVPGEDRRHDVHQRMDLLRLATNDRGSR